MHFELTFFHFREIICDIFFSIVSYKLNTKYDNYFLIIIYDHVI